MSRYAQAMVSAAPVPAVFLDRDDTIIDTQGATAGTARPGDLADPDLVRLLPGVRDAMAELAGAGLVLVVFTSQGVVSRGGASLGQVEDVHDRVRALLEPVRLGGVYYCPFHPSGTERRFAREHAWRKPAPGMILSAAAELGLDIPRSFAVGDKPRDVEAARSAGISPERALLLRTSGEAGAHDDLPAAARAILGMLRGA
ncbi:MAG: D,D-heptose 1,7-bisphosphate phosphatase [Planctomyces sp.]|nr:D,D-heptose 1,7-bisphosphate phosphatase [Planctomyces sp.]